MQKTILTTLSTTPLSINEALAFIENPAHGATALFTGQVRNHNKGESVIGITYEVFEPLAKKLFWDLANIAQEKWGKELCIYITHFQGRLAVGELSLLIAVSAPHRDEAFQANRFLLEAIKHQSPIWKQEHYSHGNSEWVKGHALCAH